MTECDLYTAYVPNTREYRIHVFQGEAIRIQGKYLDHPEQHTNQFIKNHGQGFRFRAPDLQLNADRLEAATEAVAAVGLDFGAVDLLIGEDRKCYVLEVNSAPACSPLTASAYVEKFSEWLGIEPARTEEAPVRAVPVRFGLPAHRGPLGGYAPQTPFGCPECGYGGYGHRIGCPRVARAARV